jgi:demethylmenaquinone methyltransferase/2-methoxy-6-polyprenyl-1,4-benzoquinol methylase
MPPTPVPSEVDFGARRVPLAHKQRLVDEVFRKVAHRYDLMNDLMSGGVHRAWKNVLVTSLDPPKSARSFDVADLAGGTGDIAFRVVKAGGAGTAVTVLDVNDEMLKVGHRRAIERGLAHAVGFVRADASNLPCPNATFDAVAIGFGIRNVPRLDRVLIEAHRVLKLGGQFACLEFSTCDVPGLDRLYNFYSSHGIPALGRAIIGDAQPYRYLVESIRRFPSPEALAALMRNAGLRRVSYKVMSGGIVTLHSGWRL